MLKFKLGCYRGPPTRDWGLANHEVKEGKTHESGEGKEGNFSDMHNPGNRGGNR